MAGEAQLRCRDRPRVAIDADDTTAGQDALDERAGHTAGAERGVDGDVPLPGLQVLYELV